MSDGSPEKDQPAETGPFPRETPRLRQRLGRSLSASSSSSFDSCSDLLGSLENAAENPDNPRSSSCIDDKEAYQRNDGGPPHPESFLGGPSPGQCEGAMKEEVSSHEGLRNEAVKGESTAQKEQTYGLSGVMSFSKVRSLAENTVERFSQLQTSLYLPTSYIFHLKNASQADSIASQKIAATDVLDIHGEHIGEKQSDSGEVVDANARILQPKQPVSISHDDVICENYKSDDIQSEDIFIQEDPGTRKYAIMPAESSADVKNVGDSISLSEENTLISQVSNGDAVATADDFLNVVVKPDASSRASLAENSEMSDLPVLAPTDGLLSTINHMLQEDPGLHSFNAPLSPADFRTNSSVLSHPLRTFSSGSGRPDLEEVDDHTNIYGEMGVKEHHMDLINDRQICGDSSLNANSRNIVNNAHIYMGSGLDSEAPIPRVNQPFMYVQNEGFSPWTGTNQEGELFWHDHPSEVGHENGADSECSQPFRSEEEAFGGVQRRAAWRGLSFPQVDESKQNDSFGPDELCRYVERLQLNESYVDTVLDMEDVLLNRDENSNRESFLVASSSSVIGTPRSSRDGSLSSSTSGLHLSTSCDSTPFMVDWVEVVGAKQIKGGSSFGERIVGVKDHTVYCIKVFSSNQEWEVLRRYRDFVDLYHQLRRKFNFRKEICLPSAWKEVERDSRKIFGSTHPNVVEIRSGRIEKCLQSLIQAGPPLSTSTPLCWFLSPQSRLKGLGLLESQHLASAAALPKGQDVQLGAIESPHLQSPRSELGSHKGRLANANASASLGKTVKLDLKTHPNKNIKQLLSAQHYSCAGCYKHLETDKGLVHGFVQTLGWGKPRLCEYSGQLFCTSCHLNESAVLPAQVLWHWDFTPRRVSQLAKAYLDSIYDQPMLCVSAVNPYLYSRVPILSHVKETRRKLSKMLSCILCPYHARIFQTMGSRRYLMENNDFFALRDLEDLSKGAFAVLPSLLKAVLENLRVHITKQCSVCSETGEWCGSGVLCEEPFSPIFPFEEENITNCKVCRTAFHKVCFSKFSTCPACLDEQKNKLRVPEMSDHPQMEGGFAENHRDVELLLQNEGASASSALAGTDVQGRFELDRQAHANKNWPSLYNLFPKKRLWQAFGV